ncbi:hypothetical protein LTS08_001402 [Lithohypha guttulata]|uniref:uncharacterized protein n=1 Tax=Lithohypha guttulata TaxID=1690604 RepID=UPI002DDF8CA2|nr:hypothetical protein LTR51_003932 [Lithohypha guttulata]KAK5105128.1 hypothetical protein LTS08_001402 [Lithohypha guttulata]
MSTPFPHNGPVGPDTLITVKILVDGQNRRFKLALRDLGAHVFPQKIAPNQEVKFDRYSDSAGTYVTLDSANPGVYKQLYRAAKAKLKLRLKATIIKSEQKEDQTVVEDKAVPEMSKRNTYLETVLSNPPTEHVVSFKPFQPNPIQPTTTEEKSQKLVPKLSMPTLPTMNDFTATTFSIDCNHCGGSVSNEHYHCSKCEKGDFDLCPTCIARGITCDGDDHWLIKRTIKNGKVFSSNTETLPPKKKSEPLVEDHQSAVFEEDQRTCNSCIIQLVASSFVTCQQCADYDLCFFCLEHGEHGHHPAHTFSPVDPSASGVSYIKSLCQQGRGLKHEAVCDGCDAQIVGVRHKCLTCPDFDYCSMCHSIKNEVHKGHRFAPIYEHLATVSVNKEQHKGIYCDGPLCLARARKTYIRGDRYKCAICHDTDFCANCEAHPENEHNKTHPLIKLRSSVMYLSVASVNDDGRTTPVLCGDRPVAKHASTETTRPTLSNAATQVQTIAETVPVETVQSVPIEKPVSEEVKSESTQDLQAWFECDSTPDGSSFAPDRLVSQSWTLRNPGPQAWPAGCAVYFIGGDDMRNLDDKHPSSVSTMAAANQSNVLQEPLQPGKTATFSVLLKSPSREGRAISYWRIKTSEGLPFGHKLWVDITVTNKPSKPVEVPAIVPIEAPAESKANPTEAAEKSQDSSQMIFPTLEKESPESSMHDIKEETTAVEPSVVSEDQDLVDDLDDMTLGDENTEDGFMTDEEYDILDAEDESDVGSTQVAKK